MKWSKISKYIFFWRRKIQYKKAKGVIKYLERNYGKAYKKNNGVQQQFKQKVMNDHSLEQLKEMTNRLKAEKNYEKETKALISIPFTIMIALCTVSVNISSKLIDNITKITPNHMIDPDLYIVLTLAVCIIFFLTFTLYQILDFGTKSTIKKLNRYKVLIDECIEKKEKHRENLTNLFNNGYDHSELLKFMNFIERIKK
ncbi:hypothetical protein [Bacillus subtilis]|jgi:hypothetical protein|uniref:hypothetical protein n=1 Tax=Bacillus subtilis TaxID=1423 RepID=UPI000FA4AEF0|nr:hypothetical protein [Bacillus subtilis]RPK14512.1 hypothetical protein EH5_01138 [Bacillus subtilis]